MTIPTKMPTNTIKHLLVATTVLISAGCSHMAQDLSTTTKIDRLRSNSAAQPYMAVVKRAEKAYNKGNLKMANNLIAIVDKKMARKSNY